jgi:phosphoglucomutase
VEDLRNVVDMDGISAAGLHLAVYPLGGAGVHYWEPMVRNDVSTESWELNWRRWGRESMAKVRALVAGVVAHRL